MIIESFYSQILELFGLSKNGAFSSKCPFKGRTDGMSEATQEELEPRNL
jgi:hypothetical protein